MNEYLNNAVENVGLRAVVQGALLEKIPEDLYIPPDALEVFLETFEGPLDLLLYLIKKQNLDILNIPVASITHQYLAYIELMSDLRVELAAEYLLMAAMLTEIKSRLLLPKPANADPEEDDPRADLIRRLQEYERLKNAAEELDKVPRLERDIFLTLVDTSNIGIEKQQPQVKLENVLLAFQDVLRREQRLSHHQVQREPLSVRERMSNILDALRNMENLAFSRCFTRTEGKHGAVVAFLAVLELCKEGLVEISQSEPLTELKIQNISN